MSTPVMSIAIGNIHDINTSSPFSHCSPYLSRLLQSLYSQLTGLYIAALREDLIQHTRSHLQRKEHSKGVLDQYILFHASEGRSTGTRNQLPRARQRGA